MAHQRLHATQRNRVARDTNRAQKIKCRFLAALDHQRQHRPRLVALLFHDALLLRVFKQRRKHYALEFSMPCQRCRNVLRVFSGAPHAQTHRGKPPIEHPAFVRLQNRTEQTALRANLPNQVGVFRQQHAADHIAEAGKVFRRRIHDQIGTVQQRMLERGTEQRVVHHHNRLRRSRLRRCCDTRAGLLNVGHDQRWVRGGFHQHHPQVLRGTDRGIQLRAIASDHAHADDAVERQEIFHQMLRAAINRHRVHNRVSGAHERHHRRHDSRHSRIENQG